jgi:2-polyprenyl-3-methyl-5-hydroxy-6-metoxy-1,4-benzoquinol methylase
MNNTSERDHWEGRYNANEPPPWDTGRVSLELQRRITEYKIQPCRAVEFGCGTGTNAIWLAQNGFDVTAIDISPTALARAAQNAAQAGVSIRFVPADVAAPPDLGDPFSFFFDRGCYHAVRRSNATGILKSLDRHSSPNAMGVVLTGNAKEERKPGPPVVTEAIIRAELGSIFEIVSLDEFRFDQSESDGHRHLGWSVVLRKPS